MLEALAITGLGVMAYSFTGAFIFRKVFFRIKSLELSKDAYTRSKWNSENKYWWTFGCMAGAALWPLAGFFVGLYYTITAKQITLWEKEQQLIKLREENDKMERELKIGKYAPTESALSQAVKRKAEINGYLPQETHKQAVIRSLMEELDRVEGGIYGK